MEGVHLPSGIPGFGSSSDPLEAILGPFPCVRLKGLPLGANLEDVIMFFQGFVILDVLMLTDEREAFVVFTNPMDYQMALAR
jgi:heterogeneous nuclear ribonucleoprotein F/H